MSVASKTLALAGLTRLFYAKWQLQHMLSGILAAAVLALITAILVSAMLIGSLYAVYLALLHYGMEVPAAALIAVGLFIILTAALAACTVRTVRRLTTGPRRWLSKYTVTARVGSAMDSFIDGLMAGDLR